MQSSAYRRLIAVLTLCTLASMPVRACAEGVLIFAAASLKTALDQAAATFEQQTGAGVTISYAATSVLARQIQLGAPADIFISANVDWMDFLEGQNLIDPSSRVDLLGNGLVLIGAAGPSEQAPIGPGFDLPQELGDGYLAMALIDAVPAGIYGKAALQELGLWDDVSDRVAQADNVRAALALVATGAAPLGIVYRSDAVAENRVRVIGTFADGLHPPIIYPAALTPGAAPEARQFLDYLQKDATLTLFKKQGFSLPGG